MRRSRSLFAAVLLGLFVTVVAAPAAGADGGSGAKATAVAKADKGPKGDRSGDDDPCGRVAKQRARHGKGAKAARIRAACI